MPRAGLYRAHPDVKTESDARVRNYNIEFSVPKLYQNDLECNNTA